MRFTIELEEDKRMMRVFPGEASIAEGKLSILAPIGAALIGLSAEHSIDWTALDRHTSRVIIDRITAPTRAMAPPAFIRPPLAS